MDLNFDLPVPHEDGSFVNERIGRIAEILASYDRTIEVRWIPPNRRGADDPAFAIVHAPDFKPEYVMFYVKDESEFDERVLERVFASDATKHGNTLSVMDQKNMAFKAMQAARMQEQMDEQRDLHKHILASPKTTYRHNGVKYE